jgi:phenylpyruvate tautomerase PptA (4-oxalocrotonate tautomerase family)
MPLVRISVLRGRPAEQRRRLGNAVHAALVEAVGVPALDRFQVISEHAAEDLVYDPSYLGVRRTDGIVIVQITFSSGRSLEQKRSLYRTIAENLAREGVRPEDVWINLVEVPRENWSFGNGVASYAPAEQAA